MGNVPPYVRYDAGTAPPQGSVTIGPNLNAGLGARAGLAEAICDSVGGLGAGNYALPNSNGVLPAMLPAADARHHFAFPSATLLTAVRVFGDPAISTTNTLADASPSPISVDVDLYQGGVYSATLATIPAGSAAFNLLAAPMIPLSPATEFQIVLNLSARSSGTLTNVIVTFGTC